MKNLDMLQQKKAEIANKMNQAMKDNNEEAFASAFEEYTNILQEAVLAEAKGLVQAADNTILAGRGVRVLTSEERQYYEKTIEAMKSSNPFQFLIGRLKTRRSEACWLLSRMFQFLIGRLKTRC